MCGYPIHLPGFETEAIEEQEQEIIIQAHSTSQQGICPNCQNVSSHVHSNYQRSPRDLPVSDYYVRLALTLKRYRCKIPPVRKRPLWSVAQSFLQDTLVAPID